MTNQTRRQSRSPLNRDLISRAAVRIADEAGVALVTMRRLAKSLNIEAMSLYHHVANKADLLDCMVDQVFSEMELPQLEEDWKAAMRKRASSIRQTLTNHPWSISLANSRSNPGPETLRHSEAVLRMLRTAGFSISMAAHAFSVLDSYIYGFVLQEQTKPFDTSAELDDLSVSIFGGETEATYPYLNELVAKHVLTHGYVFGKEFDFGLNLILDALERRKSEEATERSPPNLAD
ncbi:TetR/AcrR family transcriptional regulator [Candidatus Bipolaricaulota bacterium]